MAKFKVIEIARTANAGSVVLKPTDDSFPGNIVLSIPGEENISQFELGCEVELEYTIYEKETDEEE